MSEGSRFWLLPLAALLLVAVALWTTDTTLATVVASLAALLAGLFAIFNVGARIRWEGLPLPTYEADALTQLRNAFHQGRFGRETILARLDALDPGGDPAEAARRLEGRAAWLVADEGAFLDMVERRLTAIEART